MLLVVPSNANFSDTAKPCSISNIDSLSHLDTSAIHDTEISNSMHIISLQFDLIAKGFIVITKKNTISIKPQSVTSKQLICGLESLSDTKTFTIYIKPNDYALVGLKEVCNRLSNTGTQIDIHKMKETYIRQAPELMEWNRLGTASLLPPYSKNLQLSPEVQAPRSPPIIFEQETPSVNVIKAAIAETLPRTPTRCNSISMPSVFSPDCEEFSDIPVNLDDIEMNFDVDSDEEQLAKEQLVNLDPREPNQQLDYDSEVSQKLNSKLLRWMQTAIRINPNIHEHKHLTTKFSILGNSIRISNASVFDATLLWCSALFFYDPSDSDSDNNLGLWEERNVWLISDIARLIQWANRMHYGIEIDSLLKHFIKLGVTARTVALDINCSKDKYYDQKSVCIVCILAEFSKLGDSSGIGKEDNRRYVSRKRIGTHSNVSKRVKM
ncbi:hypothetical protein BOTCAL_0405g00020 [Botryotinia calthae]|uniref:Uncharacterized protein n=1 Tax=Botryotinia calthae TaxID=38488 RepID=A0A4Y8CPX9_9HELO|nr:hypothetical protein BOTCAL_0405g00020 [Botryotinia calthae]